MLVVKLFIYFFSLLNRKLNKDSENALKTVIFLLQIIQININYINTKLIILPPLNILTW